MATQTRQLKFNVSDDVYDWLEALAKIEGATISFIARRILVERRADDLAALASRRAPRAVEQ